MGQLSKYPTSNVAFNPVVNVAACGIGSDSMFCLADAWSKRLPTVNKFEIPDLPWLIAEEGIEKLREIGTLAHLSLKTYSPSQAGSRGHIFHHDVEKQASNGKSYIFSAGQDQ